MQAVEKLGDIEQMRAGRSFWPFFMITGLIFFVIEGLFADHLLKSPSAAKEPSPTSAPREDV